jgi:tetratricopeptide (TPR) repeat protein
MISLALLTFCYGWPILGGWLRWLGYALGVKYAFAIMRRTAQGRFSAPKVTGDMVLFDNMMVIKNIIIYIIVGLACFWVFRQMGSAVGFLFLAFVLLLIPAMIIMLVATESLISALNPVLFINMAWRIGWSYLLMYFFMLLLLSAPFYLHTHITGIFPGPFQVFLFSLVESYYGFVMYHLMGYVLIQYHEEIGYDVDVEEDELVADGTLEKRTTKNEILNRVDLLIQDGKADQALALIKEETGGRISEIQLAERYYKLLNIKQSIPELLEHARLYLDMLIKEKAGAQVCKVYQDCLAKDPGFMLPSATLLKVAGFLTDSGKPEEAVQTYNRFIKSDPKNPLIPKAYFLAASVINEKLKNKPKAASILNAVIKKYPNHEIIPYVQRYLKQMAS